MVNLVEIADGKVIQVITFINSPGKSALQEAENLAKLMCEANGIEYTGKISCDLTESNYSIQIVESKQ